MIQMRNSKQFFLLAQVFFFCEAAKHFWSNFFKSFKEKVL